MKVAELSREMLLQHALVQCDERALALFRHSRKVSAPFVFHPDRIHVFGRGADNKHDLCGIDRCEYVRLELRTCLVFQGDMREEHPPSLGAERPVKSCCKRGIFGSSAVSVAFLVAYENIVGLLVQRNRQYLRTELVKRLGFQYVDTLLISVFRYPDSLAVILVVNDGGVLYPVDGRNTPVGFRLLDVFHAVAAEYLRPVDVGFVRAFPGYLLIY